MSDIKIILKNINIERLIKESEDSKNLPIAQHKDTPKKKKKYTLSEGRHKLKIYQSSDIENNTCLPIVSKSKCWWCRQKFNTKPFGCPINYIVDNKNTEKKFQSMNYIITDGTDYFETEGFFCSLPCIKSYILDKMNGVENPKYSRCITLLTLMANKLTGHVQKIKAAPPWNLIKDYGGLLTKSEYRDMLGKTEYEELSTIKRPYMFPTSSYIREIDPI